MRVAVCLSGQPRSVRETFPYIYNNIIKPNNADVFIHTYFDPDNLYMEKIQLDRGNCSIDASIMDTVLELYKPKVYLVEKPKNFTKINFKMTEFRLKSSRELNKHKNWTDEEHTKHIIKQMMSQYYSIYKSNELKENYANENGFVYDFVIRLRFDLVPRQILKCEDYNPNFIYYQAMEHPDHIISDWINFGSNLIMNIYSSVYLQLEYFNSLDFFTKEMRLENTLEISNTCGANFEYMIRDIMTLHNIPSKAFDIACILYYAT
jgi:hypothetical protein